MNVAAILKDKGQKVATASGDVPLEEIARRLSARRIGAIVVVGADGRLQGIISERDIIRAVADRGAASLAEPVSRSMTKNVITCSRSDSIDEIMSKMTKGRFRHLPVVEDNSLVGIVSIGDVVKNHIAEIQMESTAMRTYFTAGHSS